jgi:hypothetical protein
MKRPVLIFLHIPKTAGSSLGYAMHRRYKRSSIFLINGNDPERSVKEFMALPENQRAQYQCISGHIPFGLHTCIPGQTVYVTMLREPVKRIISLYYHVLREQTHYLHEIVVSKKMSLPDFADSNLSREISNDQTRMISGLGGWNQATDKTVVDDDAFALAKENIERYFPVVGLTEMFDESLLLMQDAFAWDSVLYSKKKVAEPRVNQAPVDAGAIAAIKNQNQYDLLLYEYAKQRLQNQIEAQEGQFSVRIRWFQYMNKFYNYARNYKTAPVFSILWNALIKAAEMKQR